MTKLRKEELLDYFDSMCLFLVNHHWTKRDERAVAIKELLQKPEVTEEWILEWEKRLTHYAIGLTYKEANREIRTMLKEIGVRVA